VIDWVHSLGKDWGHWVRRQEAQAGRLQGTLGRIMDEGPDGAAIRSRGTRIPIVDFPEDVRKFHRAWLNLERQYQMIIWVDYRMRVPVQRKFELMNRKKNAYYRLRDKAHSLISWEMAAM
jgi:hypothetical protein